MVAAGGTAASRYYHLLCSSILFPQLLPLLVFPVLPLLGTSEVLPTAVCVPWWVCSSRQPWCIPLPEVGQAGSGSLYLTWHGAAEPPVIPCTEAGFARQSRSKLALIVCSPTAAMSSVAL